MFAIFRSFFFALFIIRQTFAFVVIRGRKVFENKCLSHFFRICHPAETKR
jgi:hypothetical protein